MSKQTQTHHFKTLRDAGLIHYVDYGNRKGISLRRSDITQRFPGLLQLLAAELNDSSAIDEAQQQ